MLEQEEAFYQAHQDEFREKYLRKWLVIAGGSLFGVFDTPQDAFSGTQGQFNEGEFMLWRPLDDDAVIEVGPLGIIRVHRPYEPKQPRPKAVITASSGERMTFAHA